MDFRKFNRLPVFTGLRTVFSPVLLLAFTIFFIPATARAMEISISGGVGNTGYKSDGKLPENLAPSFSLGFASGISDHISASLVIQQEPVFGRKIAAECSYDAGLMKFTAGPVFGLLNGAEDNKDAPLLQPGVRLGFSTFFLNVITLRASSDFCLITADGVPGQIYPSKAELAIGLVFPSIICTAAINQKAVSTSGDEGNKQTITDYGFYTEIFGKNSPVRFKVNFIYRTLDFKANNSAVSNLPENSAGSLVVGGGLELQTGNKAFFLNGQGSVYTFADKGEDLNNPFLYDFSAGVRLTFN